MATTQMTKRITKSDRVRTLLAKRPDLKAKEIAKRVDVDVSLVYELRKNFNAAIAQAKGDKLPNIVSNLTQGKTKDNVPLFVKKKAEIKPQVNATTEIKYSEKYTKAVDLINDYKLNFNLGSAVAHIFRANSDNKRADIKAAIWYLSNELLTTDL
jgi:hypothetical protein